MELFSFSAQIGPAVDTNESVDGSQSDFSKIEKCILRRPSYCCNFLPLRTLGNFPPGLDFQPTEHYTFCPVNWKIPLILTAKVAVSVLSRGSSFVICQITIGISNLKSI